MKQGKGILTIVLLQSPQIDLTTTRTIAKAKTITECENKEFIMSAITQDWIKMTEDMIIDDKRYFVRACNTNCYVFAHHEGSWSGERIRGIMTGYYEIYLLNDRR